MREALRRCLGRNAAPLGLALLLASFLGLTVAIHPQFGAYDVQSLALGALPLALAAAAETAVVLAGGIDLSVGPLIAVANVLSARLMVHAGFAGALGIAALVLAAGVLAGALNGLLVVVSRVADVVVTLATGFIWGGVALLILEKPGGGAPDAFQNLATGTFGTRWLPNALVFLALALALGWGPVRASRLGLGLRATGSDRVAAFRSGVAVARMQVISYALGGLFSAVGGLALTASTGIGSPLAGLYYTLSAIAAIVVGGVSLSGGRGGMIGPVLAAFILTLVPTDLIFLAINPNYGQVIQGTLIVALVMGGGLATALRRP